MNIQERAIWNAAYASSFTELLSGRVGDIDNLSRAQRAAAEADRAVRYLRQIQDPDIGGSPNVGKRVVY